MRYLIIGTNRDWNITVYYAGNGQWTSDRGQALAIKANAPQTLQRIIEDHPHIKDPAWVVQ